MGHERVKIAELHSKNMSKEGWKVSRGRRMMREKPETHILRRARRREPWGTDYEGNYFLRRRKVSCKGRMKEEKSKNSRTAKSTPREVMTREKS
jgi:hypothetical protein